MRTCTAIVILVSLAISVAGAAGPENPQKSGYLKNAPDLNISNADITNQTVSESYAINPSPIAIGVGISDTSLPAQKGEMATGPRTIGFSADPVSIAILFLLVIAVAAGIGYLVKRKTRSDIDE